MTRLFIYIMSVVSNPDSMDGDNVPFVVDNNELFFGPCKRRLRKLIRDEYFLGHDSLTTFNDSIYFIGLNGSNSQKQRKILWAGKLTKMMTFAYAFNNLKGRRYQDLRHNPNPPTKPPSGSPILVQPFNGGIEYKKYGTLHTYPEADRFYWYGDLTSSRKSLIGFDPTTISSSDFVLDRDICFLFNIIHAAHPKIQCTAGVSITDNMLGILQKGQKNKQINKFAVFGYQKDGKVEGKSGGWLELTGMDADAFIGEIVIAKKLQGGQAVAVSTKSNKRKC